MPALGITGGIGTGKTTLTRTLLRELSAELFDADECAHELLDCDAGVQESVRAQFGPSVFAENGKPDRTALGAVVFHDANARAKLEAILHPLIREKWSTLAASVKSGKKWLCFDIPLLYETEIGTQFDRVIVVACSSVTQRHRLSVARGLSDELAARIIAAQLDLREKVSRCDHLIWNDSTPASLERQATLLANWLRQRYG